MVQIQTVKQTKIPRPRPGNVRLPKRLAHISDDKLILWGNTSFRVPAAPLHPSKQGNTTFATAFEAQPSQTFQSSRSKNTAAQTKRVPPKVAPPSTAPSPIRAPHFLHPSVLPSISGSVVPPTPTVSPAPLPLPPLESAPERVFTAIRSFPAVRIHDFELSSSCQTTPLPSFADLIHSTQLMAKEAMSRGEEAPPTPLDATPPSARLFKVEAERIRKESRGTLPVAPYVLSQNFPPTKLPPVSALKGNDPDANERLRKRMRHSLGLANQRYNALTKAGLYPHIRDTWRACSGAPPLRQYEPRAGWALAASRRPVSFSFPPWVYTPSMAAPHNATRVGSDLNAKNGDSFDRQTSHSGAAARGRRMSLSSFMRAMPSSSSSH